MAKATLKKISKTFGGTFGVNNFSLDVKEGETVVLTGPSGCGKTTVLRLIAGLLEPDDGEILIGGDVVNEVEPKDRDMQMVFQNCALYPDRTAYQNMAFPLELKGVSADEIERRVRQTAEEMEITERLERLPADMSAAERQRTAIGRALAAKPGVYLLDEPFSSMDDELAGRIREKIYDAAKNTGAAVIMTAREFGEAMYASRAVVMNEGAAEQVGAPSKIFDQPANMFVAGFTGYPSMNLFNGELTYANGKYALMALGTRLSVSADRQGALRKKGIKTQEVVVGIRPEHVRLAQKGGQNSCPVDKADVRIMGVSRHITLNIGAKKAVAVVRAENVKGMDLSGKTPLFSVFSTENACLFDPKTRKNLLG